MSGLGRRVEISDSIELCIVELARVDCIRIWLTIFLHNFCIRIANSNSHDH